MFLLIDVECEKNMLNKLFYYQDFFLLKEDDIEYYFVSNNYVLVVQFEGYDMLKVEFEVLIFFV